MGYGNYLNDTIFYYTLGDVPVRVMYEQPLEVKFLYDVDVGTVIDLPHEEAESHDAISYVLDALCPT